MTAGGVAYEIEVPLSVYERLPAEGAPVELRTYQVVREDGVVLYGFLTGYERRLFGRLVTASGVGPRLALNVMSAMPAERVVRAIVERDVDVLRTVPGIGRKTAERLVFELADRLDDISAEIATAAGEHGADTRETVSALVALGFAQAAAAEAVRSVLDRNGNLRGVPLLKAALAELGR